MGLFQKQPTFDSAPLYTVGNEVTLLIVGLGNPGKEYDGTRHNIGFEVVDSFANKNNFDPWITKKDQQCIQTSGRIGPARIILCKPHTFMNESGTAVQAMQHFYRVSNAHTLVIYDELDIDFGTIRTRTGGSSAGHNGVKSVTKHCGEDYGRIRIGIGPKTPQAMDTADFVLQKFNKDQHAQMSLLLQEANALVSEYAHASGALTPETRSFIF
jgi:peptidyl-tRNA hydrolase, PTH1 family